MSRSNTDSSRPRSPRGRLPRALLHVTAYGATFVAAVTVVSLVLAPDDSGDDGPASSAALQPWPLPTTPEPGIRTRMKDVFRGSSERFAAQEEVIQQCMKKAGFHYAKLPVPASDAHPTVGRDPYGISLSQARKNGYSTASVAAASSAPEPDPSRVNRLPADQRVKWGHAFFGRDDAPRVSVTAAGQEVQTSAEGCLAQAQQTIYGSIADMLKAERLAGHLPIEARRRAGADPQMVQLNQAWARCMAQSGFPGLARPEQARAQAAQWHKTLPVRQARTSEIALATADAQCESDVDYATRRSYLENRYYTAGMRYFAAELTAAGQTHARALQRARAILNR